MQTFLPYPSFRRSAAALDDRRLGKQRVEALQVLRGLTVPGYGWRHHPAVKMWAGHVEALASYGVTVSQVWTERGYADTCLASITRESPGGVVREQEVLDGLGLLPAWLGDPDFHLAHQSALVRKDPAHYRRQFPDVPDDLPYVWPGRSA
ncbi:MAG TPA: MSMEG_6728 family protein [Mycobacteriales bacterium]|nr:MSMEG_6728 family protein [Mycobacteriales bacterium]